MKRKWILFLLLQISSVYALAYPLTPNLETTPSSICDEDNPDFSEYRYKEKIPYCRRNVSGKLKTFIYDMYQIPRNCRRQFTIDHFIPLSIGGDNRIENLWPEHHSIKQQRPNLEYDVYEKLRDGKINQKTAIQIIYSAKMNLREIRTQECWN
jgi:hypothetical protein